MAHIDLKRYLVADAGYGSFNNYLYSRPVRENEYGRIEETYQCEDCSGCQLKEQCCKCEETEKFSTKLTKKLVGLVAVSLFV